MTGPERIWARRECQGFGGGWMGTWRETLHEPEADRTEYVRADIHDEVRSYLASCIAMIEHAIGPGNDVFIEPDTRRRLSDARAALEKVK